MIRWVEDFSPLPAGEGLLWYRVLALWECYGRVPFVRFYRGDSGSALAMLDGQAIVYAVEAEREEAALFIAMQPDITSVLTDPATAALIAAHIQANVCDYPIMRYERAWVTHSRLEPVPAKALYSFLQPIFPHLAPFEVWYADVSYRERHGFCRNVALCEAGIPVSCAMTVAEWSGGAQIGGVATTPVYRQRGLAGLCVRSLTARLRDENREVYICPKHDKAQHLYETNGFAVCGRVATIERN